MTTHRAGANASRICRMRLPRLIVVPAVVVLAACVNRLPDQDLRIRTATPVAKMSAADLWQDYQKDARQADGRYWGRAVELSGVLSSTDVTNPAAPTLIFTQAGGRGLRARLLDEDAPAILKTVAVGQRVTLVCFCEGLSGDVILKSCILK